ncbi:DUF1672 family protein [Listeria seeligeri]|uniref:DUF1672 family protein n=1 Tax=Listeria seeligeri TaxID=1640 RepID=UPI003100C221
MDKTASVGYAEKYYFIVAMDTYYPNVYQAYLENQEISSDKIKELFAKDDPLYENTSILMEVYSKENKLPKQKMADDLAKKFNKKKESLVGYMQLRFIKILLLIEWDCQMVKI